MQWIIATIAGLVLLLVGAVLWMTSVPGRSYTGPLPELTPEQAGLAARLERHVRAIATEPHNVAHPQALERAAGYIERVLEEQGHKLHRQIFTADGVQVRNIEIVIEPAAGTGAATLVVGAHYDSYLFAPGANDNGTGVAGVLELARSLGDRQGRLRLRLRLVLFANEEPPDFRPLERSTAVSPPACPD